MKFLRKILNSLLVFITFYSICFPFGVSAAVDVSQGASKGDLRLGTYDSAKKNKIEVVKTDANDVSVKKVVTKDSVGAYNVEFFVKGPKTQVTTTTTLPVYVVFVIDRSYSMRNDSRWTNAETAAINISKEFSKLGVNMAAVAFSGGRTKSEANGGDQIAYNDVVLINQGKFSKNPITDFGNYDDDNQNGGGTNMYAGLQKANELLSGKTGVKHIILLTDGVPTFYYDANGYTKGPGNSNRDDKIAQVPDVINRTVAMANTVKANGITIHTLGYHLDKLTYVHSSNKNLKERDLAIQTLQSISSFGSTYHLVDSNSSTNVSIELGNIKEEIMNLNVANDPIIEDGIGSKFKLSSSSSYGGTKKLSISNYGVENSWTSLGSFKLNIDPTSPTGWYATNANFTFKYTHVTKGSQKITIIENPEVYWTQPVSYVIKHVEKGNTSNVLKTETGNGEINANITVSEKSFSGYTYDSKDKNKIVLNVDIDKNIAYVYYVKNSYDYKILHVEKNNTSNVLATESASAKYKETINVNSKTFEGYTYDSKDKDKIVIDTANNIAYVYYTKNSYDYTIIHQEKNNPSNVLETIKSSAKYKDIISVNKKTFTGYTYDSQDKTQIVIDKTNNIAYVYYVKNSYDYKILHVEKDNTSNVLATESANAKYNEIINVNSKTFEGYTYDSKDKDKIVIDTKNNIAYVYYTKNNYDYKIIHREKNNPTNVFETETGNAKYQDVILVNKKEFEGFTYDNQDKDKIIIDTENNIAYVEYTRNSYDYKIIHREKNNPTNIFETETGNAKYQDVILVNKKEFEGFTYDNQDKDKIIIDTENNIAYVEYTRNSYDYKIIHREKNNPTNVFETETGNAKYQDVILVNKKEFEGFTYDSQDKDKIIIDIENNIAYVEYTRNIYSYRVEYYQENIYGEFEIVEEDTVVVENSSFGSTTSYDINEYIGYTYDETLTENGNELQPANNDLVIRLYYRLNESNVNVYYVVKFGDSYIPFDVFAYDFDGKLIPEFENVELEDVFLTGKIGVDFVTEYRSVTGYKFLGIYEGNIITNNDINKIDGKIVTGKFKVESQEYTYVYEYPMSVGDEFPPHTNVEENLLINMMNIPNAVGILDNVSLLFIAMSFIGLPYKVKRVMKNK